MMVVVVIKMVIIKTFKDDDKSCIDSNGSFNTIDDNDIGVDCSRLVMIFYGNNNYLVNC